MHYTIQNYLEKFRKLEIEHPGPVMHSVELNFKQSALHLVFCGMIHGDEVGSLPAFIETIEKLKSGKLKFKGKLTFFLGNVPAALQNKRFLEADLNRSFSPHNSGVDHPVDSQLSQERKRALELMPLLKSCDLLFDFHQTAQFTKNSFYAFGYDEMSALWARIAGCTSMLVTRNAKQAFSATGMCVDEFVRSFGKPAVTLELSQRGFTESAKTIASLVMKRVLNTADKYFFNLPQLKKHAHKNAPLKCLFTIYKEPFSHPQKKLVDGLVNFSFVLQNQHVGYDEKSNKIFAPANGYILFPKYPPRDNNGNSLEIHSDLFILTSFLKSYSF